MLVLRESDVAPILQGLTLDECHRLLQALWRGLAAYSCPSGLIHQPMRDQIATAENNISLFMPASDTTTTTGIKVVTLPGTGGPPRGAIALFSPAGTLEGVLNAEMITAFRTALASMIPFHLFASSCSPSFSGGLGNAKVAVFGAGKQAEWHIRLALLIAPAITRVTVVNRGRASLENLRVSLESVAAARPSVTFVYISKEGTEEERGKEENYEHRLRETVSEADAIFCCTPSPEPLFPDSYLRGEARKEEGEEGEEGTAEDGNKAATRRRFISLIGSYRPHMHEVDTDTLLSGQTLLVDSRQACLAEAGELISAGVGSSQLTEIGQLCPSASASSVSLPAAGNIVFKCVGMGIMDLVVGRELLCLAGEKGVGVPIPGF